jgi:hypothetical protein
VAPIGTVTFMLVEVAEVTLALVAPKKTILLAAVALKLVPARVIVLPVVAVKLLIEVIVGGGGVDLITEIVYVFVVAS